jgi:hypothetical protein
MMDQYRERLGDEPAIEVSVRRGTDTETIASSPQSVAYGEYTPPGGNEPYPLVMLNYHTESIGLPPWRRAASMKAWSDPWSGTFENLMHIGTRTTGKLKTVDVAAESVSFVRLR